MSSKQHKSLFSFPWIWYPVALLDYFWVICIYVAGSFSMGVVIDGHLIPPFDYAVESKETSWFLTMKIICQVGLQGFLAILLVGFMQSVPTPMQGLFGYNSRSSMGALLRNPAIVSVLLFALSTTLQTRIKYLYSRYDKNSPFVLQP